MAIIKNLQATSAGEGVEKREPSYSVGGNIFCYSHWWPVWRFLKKLKAEITYNLAIILLGTYLDKNMVRKDICTTVFIAMLFPTAKTSKKQIWPSGDEWLKQMQYIYMIKYYSAIKKNEIMSFASTWVDLEIDHNKWSQTEKDKYHMILLICGI